MSIIEILQGILPIFGVVFTIINNRSIIYNRLSKSNVGLWIMSPIMLPYVIWGLYKLSQDQDFLRMIESADRQRKISDYF